MTIELINEKYAELNDAGKAADYNDVTKIIDRIADGMMLWFYSADEQLPHLWPDHYYVCHQNSEEPTNGFFHLMVTVLSLPRSVRNRRSVSSIPIRQKDPHTLSSPSIKKMVAWKRMKRAVT